MLVRDVRSLPPSSDGLSILADAGRFGEMGLGASGSARLRHKSLPYLEKRSFDRGGERQ
jgi:hypothetical protein